jgi:hypothetical protein
MMLFFTQESPEDSRDMVPGEIVEIQDTFYGACAGLKAW